LQPGLGLVVCREGEVEQCPGLKVATSAEWDL
jgi:hypothetical protein